MRNLKDIKEFTDAEAEAFLRYLTKTQKKRLLTHAVARTRYGKQLWIEWLKYSKWATGGAKR